MEQLTITDFEEYQEYLKAYEEPSTGIIISNNEAAKIEMPKLHEKTITRLGHDEVEEMLDHMEECGQELLDHQWAYYNKTIIRDLAIHYSTAWNSVVYVFLVYPYSTLT